MWARYMSRVHTFCVVALGEVQGVLGARYESGPESTSDLSSVEPGKIDVIRHAALFEGISEVLIIYLVLIQRSDQIS